jgi:hypothetical protein
MSSLTAAKKEQIDLMFFSGGAVGPQRWAGALVCVDVYSRYAWAELVKQDPKPLRIT